MKHILLTSILSIGALIGSSPLLAQVTPTSILPARDTSVDKTNNSKWRNEEARVTYQYAGSSEVYREDTEIHTFHRRPFIQPWARDLGNPGSPAYNLMFTPENKVGPTLGYHANDIYRFNVDSLKYYNTSRPYSLFTYQMGGRKENYVNLLHTQNIKPNWNVMVDYRKIVSPGYYKIQRNNHDNAALSTNYKSLNKHYSLYGGITYNKEQHDEDGGIVNADNLTDPKYWDRRTVATTYDNNYSTTRSTVSNVQRDFTMMIRHGYTWGQTDTVYDKNDTGAYTYTLTPRFSIAHQATMSTEKHMYKDLAPDSMRYVSLFQHPFPNDGSGYYSAGSDSVYTVQKWFWLDNKLVLTGYIGSEKKHMKLSVGAGIRYDRFLSDPIAVPIPDSPYYKAGKEQNVYTGSYIEGTLAKETTDSTKWDLRANAKIFTAGSYAGNFDVNGYISRRILKTGLFTAGLRQQNGSPSYSMTTYSNMYVVQHFALQNEQITNLYATLSIPKIRFSAGARNYTINNFMYLNDQQLPTQYNVAFSVPQFWIRKTFRVGSFFLDNELVYQAPPDNAPVNLPTLMGRHQLSFERGMFRNALYVVAGVQCRYNTEYNPAGYSALFNRFYYQTQLSIWNTPELSAFFNFRIKRFRAFVMGDNLQQLFARNAILFVAAPAVNYKQTGVTYLPVYAAANAMLRIGFSWAMVN